MSKTISWKHGLIQNPSKLGYRQFPVNDVVDEAWRLRAYQASNILVGVTENWNVLAYWATGFKIFDMTSILFTS